MAGDAMTTGPITVLVADDEPLARRRLLRLLRAEPDIEEWRSAKADKSAVEQILARSPDSSSSTSRCPTSTASG